MEWETIGEKPWPFFVHSSFCEEISSKGVAGILQPRGDKYEDGK